MKIALIILFFTLHNSKSDALLDAIYGNWNNSYLSENSYSVSKVQLDENYSDSYSENPNDSGPEFYSWELGTRDDIPETIIIYDSPRCWCE